MAGSDRCVVPPSNFYCWADGLLTNRSSAAPKGPLPSLQQGQAQLQVARKGPGEGMPTMPTGKVKV